MKYFIKIIKRYTKEKTELLLKMIPKDDDETSSLHWGILHADLFTFVLLSHFYYYYYYYIQ